MYMYLGFAIKTDLVWRPFFDLSEGGSTSGPPVYVTHQNEDSTFVSDISIVVLPYLSNLLNSLIKAVAFWSTTGHMVKISAL